MLVLTRKSEQKIIIGSRNKIVITVLKIQGGMVSLGFEAPEDTAIFREEIWKEMEKANAEGAVDKDSTDMKGIAQKFKLKSRTRRPQPQPQSSETTST